MEPDHKDSVVQNEKNNVNGPGGNSSEASDIELVRRTKSGDIAAFEQLFNRHQRRVYNIVHGMVIDADNAADLTQEVFVRVYNSIKKLRVEEAFYTWLRTVAVNICRDFIRRKPPRMESLDAATQLDDGEVEKDVPDTAAGPEKILLDSDLQQAVRKAVASLSDDHRSVVVLHSLEGMDIKDVAKLLGHPEGTIKSRLARARNELRRKLRPYVE